MKAAVQPLAAPSQTTGGQHRRRPASGNALRLAGRLPPPGADHAQYAGAHRCRHHRPVRPLRVDEEWAARQTRFLRSVGTTLWIADEGAWIHRHAISGSGPAYVFLFIEALQEAARERWGSMKRTPPVWRSRRLLSRPTRCPVRRSGGDAARAGHLKGGTTEAALRAMAGRRQGRHRRWRQSRRRPRARARRPVGSRLMVAQAVVFLADAVISSSAPCFSCAFTCRLSGSVSTPGLWGTSW